MLNRFVLSGMIVLGVAGSAVAAAGPEADAPRGERGRGQLRMRENGRMPGNYLNEEEAAAVKAERTKIRQAVEAYKEKSGDAAMEALKKEVRQSQAAITAIEKKAVERLEDGGMKDFLKKRIERMEKDPDAAADMMIRNMLRRGEGGREVPGQFRGPGRAIQLDEKTEAAIQAEKAKVKKAAEPAKAAVEALKKQIGTALDAQLEAQKDAVAKMEDTPAKKRAEAMLRMREKNRDQMVNRQLLQLLGLEDDVRVPDRNGGMGPGFGPGARFSGREGDAPERGGFRPRQ